MPVDDKTLHFQLLKDKLEKKRDQVIDQFQDTHGEALDWLEDKGVDFEKVKEAAKKGAAAGAIGGILLTSPTSLNHRPANQVAITQSNTQGVSVNEATIKSEATRTGDILDVTSKHLPSELRSLTKEEQSALTQDLSKTLGFNVTANLEGREMNTNYGKIGQEQHLKRWEGDSLGEHASAEFGTSELNHGIAPGRGAWGFFGSRGSKEAIETEKYYVVAQTFLFPGYDRNYSKWLKHRKMVLVNPENGYVAVGAMGDAGPAVWTGKVFGGSPEIMNYLGAVDKSKMVMFFVDDPEGKVPLGPVIKN